MVQNISWELKDRRTRQPRRHYMPLGLYRSEEERIFLNYRHRDEPSPMYYPIPRIRRMRGLFPHRIYPLEKEMRNRFRKIAPANLVLPFVVPTMPRMHTE